MKYYLFSQKSISSKFDRFIGTIFNKYILEKTIFNKYNTNINTKLARNTLNVLIFIY
jgi:hypothetical protein